MYQQLILRVGDALTLARIPYAVFSPPSGMLSGQPSLTNGIRVVVDATLERTRDVLDAVETMRLSPLVEPYQFGRRTWVLPCADGESGLRFDFALARTSHDRQALTRARTVDLGGGGVRFATLEDLVVYHVGTASSTELEAARRLLRDHPSLDRDYIRDWLGRGGAGRGEDSLARFESLLGEKQQQVG